MMSTKRIVCERPDYNIIVFLLCLVLLFFADVAFFGKVLFVGDNTSINVPSKVLMFDMIRSGQFPLWNPYIFSGAPFLADINLGLLYPLTILYLLLTPLRALSYTIIIDIFLAGAFMYLYGRVIKLSRFASTAAALIFMFSGSVITATLNTPILNSIVLIPLILSLSECAVQKKSLSFAIATSMVLSLQVFAGHVQYFYYTTIFIFFYLFIRCTGSIVAKLKLVASVFIPVLFLTAVQTLPFLELSTFSTRPSFDFAYATMAAPVISLLHLWSVNVFGVFKNGTSWGATADTNGYMGIVPLIFAGIALIKIRNKSVLFYTCAAVASLLLALGKYSPLYYAAFYVIPFFSRFRSPPAVLIIYSIAISIMAGFGFDYIFLKETINKSVLKKTGLVIIPAFILSLISRFFFYGAFLRFIKQVNLLKKTAFLSRFLLYPQYQIHSIFNMWMENIAVICSLLILLLILLYFVKQCRSRLLRILLILLIMADVLLYAKNNYLTTNESVFKSPPALISFLKQYPGYRIHSLPDEGKKPIFANAKYFVNETEKASYLLSPNMTSIYKIPSIDGYASIVNKNYAGYLKSKSVDPTHVDVLSPGSSFLNELGVKYVITGGRFEKEILANPSFKPVLTMKNTNLLRTFTVYENKNAAPRAYLLDKTGNATGSAIISKSTENTVEIKTVSSSSAYLVLHDLYYPGWSAMVDNKPATIQKYKIFRSMNLPKGSHIVIFKYFPAIFIIGAVISIVNWIYLIGFLIFLKFKKHEKVDEKLHIRKSKVQQNP